MVSIITPAYNAEQFIGEAIASVIAQTYTNWELLVINDASTDNTAGIVKQFMAKDPRIKILDNTTTKGPGNARNFGIEEAKGTYMAFLDADDLWKPNKLQEQLKVLENTNANICFSSYELINEKGQHLNKTVLALDFLSYKKQLRCNYIGNLTGLYNAKKLGKIYMPEIRKRQDWVMWLRAIEIGGNAIGIKQSLAYYRIREHSVSSNKLQLIKHNFNVYNSVLEFGWLKSVGYMIIFLFEYFFVKSRQVIKTNTIREVK